MNSSKALQYFFFILILIPVFFVFLYVYMYPTDTFMFGRRWMFDEEPEMSEGFIKYYKIISIICMGLVIIAIIYMVIRLVLGV
ncbi:hypothetical protein [Caldisalinibacter kiritimatiensis]|nr:hypothetical protein [Caldisalinibacter kiritimatiensis]